MLAEILWAASSEALQGIAQDALTAGPSDIFEYARGQLCVAASPDVVLQVMNALLQLRQQPSETLSQQERDTVGKHLRDIARYGKTPASPFPDGQLNLACWVGTHTPAWYAVFSYSSPEPSSREPWFCSLDAEAQRLVLLLVGLALET